ncbi:putative HAD family hydrolase [Candidatus Fokinia solitaria]|uniref:Putative HAD family hydrolase n=1 Tax=Candidatus Fokinia solitaria TaxID=1802984 RepID=A0A2U8BS14_9RICK|nr:HAD family phosphatase [Candidatus Fokinia solitaria]AWD33144.1 putative HAD family hydrolase [Candidatus Fokinia solitaria]
MNKVVIFDFDGVIVNSEIVVAKINQKKLDNLPFDEIQNAQAKQILGSLFGQHFQSITALLEEHGLSLPEHFTKEWLSEMSKAVTEESQPLILNVIKALHNGNILKCIASNNNFSTIEKILENTGQSEFFDKGKIFTAEDVARPKPFPDLFLHAIKQHDTEPQYCVVIEDSVPGISAALAAKVPVLAFVGGCHAKRNEYLEKIKEMNVPIVHSENELLQKLQTMGFL